MTVKRNESSEAPKVSSMHRIKQINLSIYCTQVNIGLRPIKIHFLLAAHIIWNKYQRKIAQNRLLPQKITTIPFPGGMKLEC